MPINKGVSRDFSCYYSRIIAVFLVIYNRIMTARNHLASKLG